jgi:hypothetical protein
VRDPERGTATRRRVNARPARRRHEVAKLLVHGRDRAQILVRARRALDEPEVEGVSTSPAGGNSRCHDQARLAASRLRRPLPGARRLARPGERTARHEQRRLRLNMGDLGPAARRRRRRHAPNRALRRPYGYFAIATAGRSSRASRASPPPTRPRSCSRSSGSSPSACRYSAVASTPTPSPFAPSRPPPNPACSLRFARTVTLSGCGAWRQHSGRECSLRLDAGVSPAHPHTLAQDELQASAAGDRSPYRSRIRGKAGAARLAAQFPCKAARDAAPARGGLSRRLRRRGVPREFPNSRSEPDLAGARVLVFGSS